MNKELLLEKINIASHNYYNGVGDIISDSEFDNLVEQLQKVDPNNNFFKKVGIREKSTFNDVIHKIPMLSAGKIKGDYEEEIEKWYYNTLKYLGKNECEFVIEPKIDGNSVSLKYKKGELVQVSSRGDGKIGKELSLRRFKWPKTLPDEFTGELRGEAVIPKIHKDGKSLGVDTPLRNLCSGLLHKKEPSEFDKLIHVVIYKVIPSNNFLTERNIVTFIQNLATQTFPHHSLRVIPCIPCKNLIEIKQLYANYKNSFRDSYNYETDGLMLIVNNIDDQKKLDNSRVVDHHHHYEVAIKPTCLSEWSEIIDIQWLVGRTGKITPVGIIKPVRIGDVIYNRVTLNNAKNVIDNKIQKGSKVLIERSNDVIPKVIKINNKNLKDINVNIPKKCPTCGHKIEWNKNETELYCTNNKCEGQILERFVHWFTCVNIVNISENSLEKFLNYTKFTSLWQLYKLTNEDVKTLFEKSLGVSMETPTMKQFLDSFNKSRYISEKEVLGYYGIPKIGLKTLNLLKINTFTELLNYKNDSQKLVIQSFVDWIKQENNYSDLVNLLHTLKPTLNKMTIKTDNKLLYCITGEFSEPRKQIIEKIKTLHPDWEFTNTVNKNCLLLITSGDTKSSKYITALKFVCPIISYNYDIDWENLSKIVINKF
jgi:DNA ligase (NAD+)